MGKKGGKVRVKQIQPSMPKNPLANLQQGLEEIKLPPKPDPSISYPWPSHDYSVLRDCNSFHTIYPSYLDSTKTVKRGRRIAIHDAVEKPSVAEISEALQSLKLRHVIEPHKGYSRDEESRWYNPGRVLVDLEKKKMRMVKPVALDDDDDEEEDGIRWNKLVLLREIAKRVPSTSSRLRRIEEEKVAAAKAKAAKSGGGTGGGGGSGGAVGGGGSSSKKKKGKKRR